jgi:hypothetical protein
MTTNSLYQRTIGWYLLKAEVWLGKLLTCAGVPGIIRDCDYSAELNGQQRVTVRVSALTTVVSVNGLDVFVDRLTGRVRGIGHCRASRCRLGEGPQCIVPDRSPDYEPALASS